MKKVTPTITDSRRLTGPNLFGDKAGAILDVEIDDINKDKIVSLWIKHCRSLLELIGWDFEYITTRQYKGGASLVISAPIDCLYAATEVTESAWDMTVCELTSTAFDLERAIYILEGIIPEELNPTLIELQQAAVEHQVKFLFDDDLISLGYGKTCQVYSVNELPKVQDIDWACFKDIPVAMVTGTNGKSTTVRLASSVVKAAGLRCGITSTDYIRVGETILDTGDYSGPGGARTLLRHPQTQTAFLEVARGGMLRRGLGINQATCVVVTNVAEDHLGEYGINTLQEMVEAKFTVRQAINTDQDLILNADDKGSVEFAKTLDNTIVWFSWYADNPVIVKHLKNGGKVCFIENNHIVYQTKDVKEIITDINNIPITFNGAAKHNVHNALAVTVMCKSMGFENKTIAKGLQDFDSSPENNPGRGNLFEFNGIRAIVDFAHNEHGLGLMAQTIKNMPAKRRLVLIGQAGDRSDELIEGLIKSALKAKPDKLVICEMKTNLRGRQLGVIPKLIHKLAIKHGMQETQIIHASDTVQGSKKAIDWAKSGDLLLLLALDNRKEVLELLNDLAN
ncbi:MAG: Mur ligase [Proteobacteria bacterium]|nr:Mur ligase [Pseudomonadota bacterium]